jgi:hypothetical protein
MVAMSYHLEFAHCIPYDDSKIGITLPVTLTHGAQSVSFEARVDTGASFCVFARVHGEDLDLDIESGLMRTLSTATGSFVAYGHHVALRIPNIEFATFVYFAADDHFDRCVLGRRGWLDLLRVAIVDYDREIYLSPYQGE